MVPLFIVNATKWHVELHGRHMLRLLSVTWVYLRKHTRISIKIHLWWFFICK